MAADGGVGEHAAAGQRLHEAVVDVGLQWRMFESMSTRQRSSEEIVEVGRRLESFSIGLTCQLILIYVGVGAACMFGQRSKSMKGRSRR